MKNNEISIHLQKGRSSVTGSLYQYDYGQRLIINGAVLPETYEVHFSNELRGSSKTVLGDSTGVAIPDEYLTSGDNIHVWIYLHDGDADGETEYHGIITVIKRAKPTDQEPTPVQQDVITQAIAVLNTSVPVVESLTEEVKEIARDIKPNRVTSLDGTPLRDGFKVIESIGIPVYVDDVSQHPAYGLTEKGWYIFARIAAPDGMKVSNATTVTGANAIVTVGAAYVDVAVMFDVAAMAQTVTVTWDGTTTEAFIFRASDLAVRNLDYRTTFYVYDIAHFATWEYALTTDETFVADKKYYTLADSVYTLAEVTAGEAVPAYYILADEVYSRVTGIFEDGVTYYTKSGDVYSEAVVTVGDAIPAYYNHSKLTFSGMARNVTYQFDEIIDCPQEYILPEIEDDGHGAWFEIRLRHAGSYSSTLVVPEGVKIATEHTQAETAGMNMVDLHYMSIDGIKIWRFMNTHSSIPA